MKNLKLTASLFFVAFAGLLNAQIQGSFPSCDPTPFPWYIGGNIFAPTAPANAPPHWTPPAMDIGTCNNYDFILKSNNIQSIFINTSGNVGVGAFSPTYKFSVSTSILNDGIEVNQNGTGASALHLSNSTSGGRHWALFSTGNTNTQGSGNFSIYDYNSSKDRLFIAGSTGNIGIGTNAPTRKLSIESNENQLTLGSNVSSAIRISNQFANTFGTHSELQFALSQNNNDEIAVIAAEYTAWNGNVGGDLVFGTSPGISPATMTERMRINSVGHVSIGRPLQTSSPHFNTAMLSVKGKIVAQEVIVTQQLWSDFVFDKTYKLMPLADLEKYYSDNHHLPNIPSTNQIIENGNDIGKTDALLLQKIEELTLYLVEQNKLNEQQQQLISGLKKELEDLKKEHK